MKKTLSVKKCSSNECAPANFSCLPVNYFFALFFPMVSTWTFRRGERNASQSKHEFFFFSRQEVCCAHRLFPIKNSPTIDFRIHHFGSTGAGEFIEN